MSNSEKYVDISIIEDIVEQTYHELLNDADKFREYSREVLRKCEYYNDCNEKKILRIKKILKNYNKQPDKYKCIDIIKTIEIILNEK